MFTFVKKTNINYLPLAKAEVEFEWFKKKTRRPAGVNTI